MSETVAVIGASPKPERYSYKAIQMLRDHGHRVFPVNPYHAEIAGQPCIESVEALTPPLDTVTLYVRPELLAPQITNLIALKPRRVIFNPGTESVALAAKLRDAGISTEDACTLVLLRTGQF